LKAEGTIETRRGSILVRNPDMLWNQSCRRNEAVKGHFDEVFARDPSRPRKGQLRGAAAKIG